MSNVSWLRLLLETAVEIDQSLADRAQPAGQIIDPIDRGFGAFQPVAGHRQGLDLQGDDILGER